MVFCLPNGIFFYFLSAESILILVFFRCKTPLDNYSIFELWKLTCLDPIINLSADNGEIEVRSTAFDLVYSSCSLGDFEMASSVVFICFTVSSIL